MISHFWNLCRACPALDVDKVEKGAGQLLSDIGKADFGWDSEKNCKRQNGFAIRLTVDVLLNYLLFKE